MAKMENLLTIKFFDQSKKAAIFINSQKYRSYSSKSGGNSKNPEKKSSRFSQIFSIRNEKGKPTKQYASLGRREKEEREYPILSNDL